MRRQMTAVCLATLVALGQGPLLLAQRPSRGSVSGASRGTATKSGGTTSATTPGGRATGSRTVTKTGEGYDVNKQIQTQGGASKTVDKSVDVDDRSVDRESTTTNKWGQSVSREREVEGQGGYATIEGKASTSTGREASADAVAGRNRYGQPAVAGTVNTKYNGSYATAAARNPYGGYTKATVGPYGGKVTTTLPSGYRTTTYYGRPYYTYGGAYYRPYRYGGIHYYYPVPPPYYAYYQTPPVGAIILMVAGVAYLVGKDASYSKKTTSSEGTVVYQSVPAPAGAQIKTLPAERVLVTLAGTTYYVCANAFYKRVLSGGQEAFVVVTPPAGAVFVQALPADFEVVQLNTMYFKTGGQYYVPFMASDGKELYVMVDTPPQPAATAAPAASAPNADASGNAVRQVSESFAVPSGTLLVARLAVAVSAATANVGDRFQGFLDQDLSADGRLVSTRGARVYGRVTAVERGKALSVELTDLKVGDQVLPIRTQPMTLRGSAAAIQAQTPQAFTLASAVRVDVVTTVAVR